MPKYYFHLFNSETIRDGEGEEIADVNAALASAEKMARGMAAQSVRDEGRLTLHHRIEVADEDGTTVGTVRFGDVVQIQD
jgi:hypothetical protein